MPSCVTQCLVELELDDEADEIPGVGKGVTCVVGEVSKLEER